MKIKDITVGCTYVLSSGKKSRMGGSSKYFELLKEEYVTVLNKLNNFNNKNTVHIQGVCLIGDSFNLVNFWCSPYDLKEVGVKT